MKERVIADDVRAFSVTESMSFRLVIVSYYGGPGNICGVTRFEYETMADTMAAVTIAKAWVDQDVPLEVVQDLSGGSTIRPIRERHIP